MSKLLSYWSTGNGDDTMMSMWNPADEAQELTLTLRFSGGLYNFPVHLNPKESRTLNVSEIIQSQVPDSEGHLIPPSIHEGSAELSGSEAENEYILVALASGTYNVRKATCSNHCQNCNGYQDGLQAIVANPFGVAVNGSKQQTFTLRTHTGSKWDITTDSTWSSSNNSLATVSKGLLNGISPGSVDVTAISPRELLYSDICNSNPPPCQYGTIGGTSPGNVTPTVTISGLDYVYIGQGDPTVAQTNLLAGAGNPTGGTYHWSSTAQGVSFDNSQAALVHVTATHYTGGTNDTPITLNYTYNGVAAAPATMNVTQRIFKYLAGDSVIPISTYNGPSTYGYVYQATYSVFANPGGQQVTTESGVSTYENVSNLSHNVPVNPNFGQGALNDNSQVVDNPIGLLNNSPLPSNLSIVDSQDIGVGGIYVRNNTLTFTNTSVTVTNNGPYN